MDGITILNTFVEELEVIQPWLTIGLALIFGGIIGATIFTVITPAFPYDSWTLVLVLICLILCVAGLFICGFAPRETETRYQVIIDDSVNFNEFQEYYEIIEVDGRIYTVRLR